MQCASVESVGVSEDVWSPTNEYVALIGGVLYENVRSPIVYEGESLIRIDRNQTSGVVAPSLKLRTQEGTSIAEVIHGRIQSEDLNKYPVMQGDWGSALVEASNGRIWCDLRVPVDKSEFEFDLSCLLVAGDGYPIILHPNRTKLNTANTNQPPNVSGLTLMSEGPSEGGAFGLTTGSSLYVLGVAIRNLATGFSVSASAPVDDDE